MAAAIGDFISDQSRFHNMIVNPASQRSHSRDSSLYRSVSRSSRHSSSVTTPTHSVNPSRSIATSSPTTSQDVEANESRTPSSSGGPSRLPSPPASSSPPTSTSGSTEDVRHKAEESMESQAIAATSVGPTQSSGPAIHDPTNRERQPSPPSDDSLLPTPGQGPSPLAPQSPRQSVIHVRDLAHVQSLARADGLGREGAGMLSDPPLQQRKFEISGMPIGDVIEMVAALLTKITTTNDMQHDAMSRNVTHQQQASQSNDANGSSNMSPLSHSVLAFHGKNVPAITILSYLSRIHKYCPTTFEVFLSLLVYFDRMTERVNDLVTKSEEARRQRAAVISPISSVAGAASDVTDSQMRDAGDSETSDDSDSDLADDDDDDDSMADSHRETRAHRDDAPAADIPAIISSPTYFVVDSFNIHRLIIAGVTCASKFFSDVFYTNSRYAKVGGLPLPELNHLEIQFLVLNDFRLAVPVEDLEAYATMLVEFYAREVVAPRLAGDS